MVVCIAAGGIVDVGFWAGADKIHGKAVSLWAEGMW